MNDMNIEANFGLKDSLASAVILAVILGFIVAGLIAGGADAGILRPHAAAHSPGKTAGVLEVQTLSPIVVTASRRAASLAGGARS
jgi:hypothetical protein